MRLELLVFFAVAFAAVVSLLYPAFTGLAAERPVLAYYPQMFGPGFDAVVIKGSVRSPAEIAAANLVIGRLSAQYELVRQARYERGMSRQPLAGLQSKIYTDSEIDYRTTDAVMIGTLCNNPAIADLLKISNCELYFEPGEGLVKFVQSGGQDYVIITGYDGTAVLNAARYFFSELQLNQVESNELRVDFTTRIPLHNPLWYGSYTTSSGFRDTRSDKVFVLGQWRDLR